MRVAYLGPEGTNSHEALLGATRGEAGEHELVPLPTIYDCVMAVENGTTERAFVPIENAIEGSVNATLDALAVETEHVEISGEVVHPIHTCLIVRERREASAIETVVAHPQSMGQCAHFLRTRLPQAQVVAASSTAEAVRTAAERGGTTAALGSRVAAGLYGCEVLYPDVDDAAGNETRFVWLAPEAVRPDPSEQGPWKTAIVFWGVGAEAPGWLVQCLSELASRDINLTRIESRPRKQGLGRYMFFADLEGSATQKSVGEALRALRGRVEYLRVLGSFPAA